MSTTSSAGVRVTRDVIYSARPGYRPLSLDLYVPESGDARAVCIYLHGGGWRVGSRRTGPGRSATWTPSFFEFVAARGLAVASVDYRLSSEAKYPAQSDDVSAAAEFLHAHAEEYGLPDTHVVWGVSAGGHLVAMHALQATRDQVAAAVCWYTPSDLESLAADIDAAGDVGDRSGTSREGSLLGAPLDDIPELVAAASPVHAVTKDAPPFLLIHGSADVGVPPEQSRRLAVALAGVGAQAQVEIVPGATHMFPELDDEATERVVAQSIEFLHGILDG